MYKFYTCNFFFCIVINITLPDEKSNYVHRIGRVGRAERMGLAISLVSTVPEKVNTFLSNIRAHVLLTLDYDS